MNNQQAKNRLVLLLVVMTAVGFYSTAQAQRVNHNVQMRLNAAQTGLDVETHGQCVNNNHKGCIEVAHNTQGRLKFTLVESNCKLPGGNKWEIGEAYLGGKGSLTKPTSWGGFQNDNAIQADFNLANTATGLLVKESGSNKNSIVIFDDNTTPNGYNIWYKVTAVCVDNNGDVVGNAETDPRIKNGGNQ
jgi:hypothetical protein